MLQMFNSLTNIANVVGFQLKKHAPEIMIIGGIVGGTTATVLACIATTKTGDIIDEAKEELAIIRKSREDNSKEYTEKDAQRDITKVYARTGLSLAKNYSVSAIIGAASIASILGGTGILNKNNAGLAMAVSSSALEVKKIRDGLVKEFGEEKGKELYSKFIYGIEEGEIKEKIKDENGKVKTVKKVTKKVDGKPIPISYIRQFDWTNKLYNEDMNYNWFFLRSQQNYFNDKLTADHFVFMNDVDKALGFDRTKPGQSVGWHHDPDNPYIDNYIDFNLTEAEAPYEYTDKDGNIGVVMRPVILMEYNVDGSILNDIDWEKEAME